MEDLTEKEMSQINWYNNALDLASTTGTGIMDEDDIMNDNHFPSTAEEEMTREFQWNMQLSDDSRLSTSFGISRDVSSVCSEVQLVNGELPPSGVPARQVEESEVQEDVQVVDESEEVKDVVAEKKKGLDENENIVTTKEVIPEPDLESTEEVLIGSGPNPLNNEIDEVPKANEDVIPETQEASEAAVGVPVGDESIPAARTAVSAEVKEEEVVEPVEEKSGPKAKEEQGPKGGGHMWLLYMDRVWEAAQQESLPWSFDKIEARVSKSMADVDSESRHHAIRVVLRSARLCAEAIVEGAEGRRAPGARLAGSVGDHLELMRYSF